MEAANAKTQKVEDARDSEDADMLGEDAGGGVAEGSRKR